MENFLHFNVLVRVYKELISSAATNFAAGLELFELAKLPVGAAGCSCSCFPPEGPTDESCTLSSTNATLCCESFS